MEDGVSKEEVSKGSFRRDGQKISLVLWVDLDAKTNCKKKAKQNCLFIFSICKRLL